MPPKPSKPVKLKVVKTSADYDHKRVKGREMFPELFANIYIAGRKKSGKTQLLYNILEQCAGRDSKVLLFGATVNKDATYEEIKKMLDRKSIQHIEYEHFIDEEGVDLLEQFIAEAKQRNADEPEELIPPTARKFVPLEEAKILFGDEVPRKQIEKKMREEQEEYDRAKKAQVAKGRKKVKILAPEYILCFDDLGEDLRKKAVSQLLIKNRHFKCKVIILSQWLNFLRPVAIRQLDYVLMFGGFNEDKLEELHQKLDLPIEIPDFVNKYRTATKEKYHFLYIDIAEDVYKEGFNNKL